MHGTDVDEVSEHPLSHSERLGDGEAGLLRDEVMNELPRLPGSQLFTTVVRVNVAEPVRIQPRLGVLGPLQQEMTCSSKHSIRFCKDVFLAFTWKIDWFAGDAEPGEDGGVE